MNLQRAIRSGILLAGLAIGGFGAWSLLRLGFSNLFWTVLWLAGGIIGHDALLAAGTLGVLALGARAVPDWAKAPVAAGLVILGAVTLMAIPVLGRFGARPDNPSLLDRSYGVGWLVFAGTVAVGVVVAAAVARHRQASPGPRRAPSRGDGRG